MKSTDSPLNARSTPIATRPGAISPYVLAWGALALLASFYLTALALRPDLVTEHLPIFRPGEPEGNQGQRAMSKAFAEVQGLRQSVSQMQLELARLKTELSSSQDHDKSLVTRIALLEEKVSAALPVLANAAPAAAVGSSKIAPAADKASEKSAKAATVAAAARATAATGGLDMSVLGQGGGDAASPRVEPGLDAARLAPARLETGSIGAPRPTPSNAPSMAAALADTEVVSVVKPKVINAPQRGQPPVALAAAGTAAVAAASAASRPVPSTAETSGGAPSGAIASDSEAAALTSFGPATITPAKPEPTTGPIGLRISNGPSLDALRLSWSLLSDRHSAQLKNLDARYAARVPEGDGDPTFDLIAGPIKTPAEARRICKALAAKNIPCQVGSFNGPSL